MPQSRQLAAIMFTDIVGYTALMGKDSQMALELIRINKEIQIPLVEKHNGKWIKEIGDGSLSYFNSALDAVNCSVEIQESARVLLDAKLRIGIHLGDVTIQNDDVYGDGVNVASRLEALADPGGIYISDATQKAIQGQTEFQTKYLGEIKLKNVSYPVRTYAVQGMGLPTAIKASIWKKLRNSKHYGLIIILMTLLFALTFRELLSFILIRLNITPVWSEIFLFTIILFIPTLITLYFIPKNKSRFLRIIRRIIIPINFVAAALTIVFSFWGRELGAMTTSVTFEDALGNTLEKTVLKNEFVKLIRMYPFEPLNKDNNSLSSDNDSWLPRGIPTATTMNILQYQSIDTWMGTDNISLKEKLEELTISVDYLVLGKYEWVNDSLVTEIQIYNKKAKIFHKQTLKAGTLFGMSDAIKQVLLDKLELHSSTKDQADLPFTSFITDNESAFRHFVLGNNTAAIEEDPDFAYAYLNELAKATRNGWGDDYKVRLAEDGLDRINKLPEQDQLRFRALYFLARGEKDKALRSFERYVEFNPGDLNILRSFVHFLATNGYYEKAIEISMEQFSEKIDVEYGFILFKLALLMADADQLELMQEEVEKVKLLVPEHTYLTIKGEIDLWHGDLKSSRRIFEEALLEKPSFYNLDSLIKVIDFLQNADHQMVQNFKSSIAGTYVREQTDQYNVIKIENNRVSILYGGQMPALAYPIDQNSIYWCNPYSTNQPQSKNIFIKGAHGQILKFRHVQQNSPGGELFESYYYKATPELLEAMEAFRLKDYTKAGPLFRQTLAYDSGYYFVRNFIEAIEYSATEDASKLAKNLHGKRFIANENDNLYLEFSFSDGVFQVNFSGGVPHTVYSTDDQWIMDSFNKDFKFKIVGNEDTFSIECYVYYNSQNKYEKLITYH